MESLINKLEHIGRVKANTGRLEGRQRCWDVGKCHKGA